MNKSIRIFVASLGTLFGLSGMDHGFFEILQGSQPTPGMWISAIGPAQKMWEHGNETAFTLIPNYLFTGIAAMLVGLAVIIWSLGFVHKKHGAVILIGLFVLLLVTGGGVAQVLFFPILWWAAALINNPLDGWRRVLPVKVSNPLAKTWPWSLAGFLLLMEIVLVLGITGFIPFVSDAQTVLTVMLSCLGLALILLPVSFVSAIAQDVQLIQG